MKKGISPRNVDYRSLQKMLLDQGVTLPGVALAAVK
jgi:hypothetical protein